MTSKPRTFTFDQFVQYGIDSGVPLTNGMPWHFHFNGFPVTHENDDHYLILLGSEPHTLHFKRDQIIVVDEATNTMTITKANVA